jgi:hypothetical protein
VVLSLRRQAEIAQLFRDPLCHRKTAPLCDSVEVTFGAGLPVAEQNEPIPRVPQDITPSPFGEVVMFSSSTT